MTVTTMEIPQPESLPAWLLDEYLRQRTMTADQLNAELSRLMEMTARNITMLAVNLRVRAERGQDISTLKIGMVRELRRVAEGWLLPEAVCRFAARRDVLNRVSALPIAEQRRCLDPRGVEVGMLEGETVTHRLADPTNMTPAEVRQVFAADHVRSPEEQIAWLRSRSAPTRLPAAPHRSGLYEVDREHGRIVFNVPPTVLTREELNRLIGELA